MKILSVITPNLNSLFELKRTVDSVASMRRLLSIEHIIIDGCSTDGSVEYLEGLNELDTLFISEKDRGIYDAMNKGIELATGSYLHFLNAGDTYCDSKNDEFILSLDTHSDIIIAPFWLTNKSNELISVIFPKSFDLGNIRTIGTATLNHQSVIVKKEKCPFYSSRFKLKGELNWYVDMLKKYPELVIKYLSNPIVEYQVGGIGSQHRVRNLLEWIAIITFRFGILQNVRNIPFYRKFLHSHRKLCEM